ARQPSTDVSCVFPPPCTYERVVVATRRGGAWQFNAKDRSVRHSAADRDSAAVDVDGPFGNGQPEPCASRLTGAAVVDAEEAIEDPLAVFGRHARAFVAHLEDGTIAVGGHLDQDARSAGTVFDRVVDDIREGLAEHQTVDGRHDRLRCLDVEPLAPFL